MRGANVIGDDGDESCPTMLLVRSPGRRADLRGGLVGRTHGVVTGPALVQVVGGWGVGNVYTS